ncbi:hypothetical protein N9188_00250 [bacterium]|nr:hypothetical protein [bacterium]
MTRLLTVAALLLSACASSNSTDEQLLLEVQTLTRGGKYEAAARAAEAAQAQIPADSPLQGQLTRAAVEVSIASGLEVVRSLSFADQDDEALAMLAELEERFPSEPMLEAWRRLIQRKQADHWFEIARSAMATGQFEAARLAYERAMGFEPDHTLAPAGLARVELLEEYRAGLAEDYYFNGVRDLTEQRLDESENSFEKSRRYDAESERTRRRIVEVRREKAEGRVAYAQQLVEDRRYAAARAEFAEARRLDPESVAIAEALVAMRVEAEVAALLSEAESFVLRSEFDEAELLIAEAGERTVLQADVVEATRDRISSTRVDLLYQRALDLEHDFLFGEAIELYREVLEGRDFYEDARARLEALETYVVEAARLYAEAQASGDPVAKLEKLRQIEAFWPEYEDILAQIRALEGE